MKDFNIRSFLAENKLTTLSKSLKEAKGTETLHIYSLPGMEDGVYLEVDVESYPADQNSPAEFDFEIMSARWDNDGDNRLSDEEMAEYDDYFEEWVSDHYGLYSPNRSTPNSNEEKLDAPDQLDVDIREGDSKEFTIRVPEFEPGLEEYMEEFNVEKEVVIDAYTEAYSRVIEAHYDEVVDEIVDILEGVVVKGSITNEAPERESALIKVAREIWVTRDIAKKKALLNSFLDTSQIKSKDTIRATAEKIFNPTRFDQYIANSVLKFEKLGLDEEGYSQKKK